MPVTPFHGTIERNDDGTIDYQPGLTETVGMQMKGHQEAGLDKGAKGEGKDADLKRGKV